jgi:hypothetical protein
MAITAAHLDETGGAIATAVAGVYGDRFDRLEVETTECRSRCPALDRALHAVGEEFGAIVGGQLTLQIALLARLAEALDQPYETVLHDVLDGMP